MSRKTEDVNPRFSELDLWPTQEAVEAMYEGQLAAIAATRTAIAAIAAAADASATRIGNSGRLIYTGAGTSGRLAVLDGVELGPTFGWPDDRLFYCLAGGEKALVRSVEGAEDDRDDGAKQIADLTVTEKDVVIGVAASGRTPFTLGTLQEANTRGALTVGISNNANSAILSEARHGILAETGSELVAGSTRMKAGTAQKSILNMLSTAIMLRLGRIYKGYMVDMIVSNEKLEKRAISMVAEIANTDTDKAAAALKAADNNIREAILLCLGREPAESRAIIQNHNGNLRAVLEPSKTR